MPIDCGGLVLTCDVPVRIDTYKGCTHNCRYCFANAKRCIDTVKPENCITALRKFIAGERTIKTRWCDWNIPLHWGGDSDPFQPVEKKYRISYEALKVFAETKYPFIVSTKGKLIVEDEYLSLIKQCNAVVQISMVSPKYDKLEAGAPTYEERIQMLKKLAPNCKRLMVRHQPYIREAKQDILDNMPRLAEAGVYGVILEAMRFYKPKKGFEKHGGCYFYPVDQLVYDFKQIRERAHECGLKFFSGEDRTRLMGDSVSCCCGDDLEGFEVCKANINHIGEDGVVPFTENMKKKGTGGVLKSVKQDTLWTRYCVENSYEDVFHKYFDTK